jgi:hypothetical protein
VTGGFSRRTRLFGIGLLTNIFRVSVYLKKQYVSYPSLPRTRLQSSICNVGYLCEQLIAIRFELQRTTTEAKSTQMNLGNVEYAFEIYYLEITHIQEGPEWEEALFWSSLA